VREWKSMAGTDVLKLDSVAKQNGASCSRNHLSDVNKNNIFAESTVLFLPIPCIITSAL